MRICMALFPFHTECAAHEAKNLCWAQGIVLTVQRELASKEASGGRPIIRIITQL